MNYKPEKPKIINYNRAEKDDFSHNIKRLEEFVEGYRKSESDGFVCFYIDKKGKGLEFTHLTAWKDGAGATMLGLLEIMKIIVMEKIRKE